MPSNSRLNALLRTLNSSSSATRACDIAAPSTVLDASPPPASQKGTEKAPMISGAPPVSAEAVHAPTPASQAA
eukprot:CAMPEP_0169433790 /NCGR_PEP_ID=MMETSP1042-20121227/4189_1 /TAXON_ID=464988 /ORGANISM="Hemiselmis andersenii, Strain CCMP1180" /LENGTH=72 /DNA_ID=CAMNT_0009544333 /DNA_START=213 /DNA_END=428 /DNA_ORIENTATION=+